MACTSIQLHSRREQYENPKSEVKQMKAIWSLIAIVVLANTMALAQTTNQQNSAPPRGTAGSALSDAGPDAAQNGNAAQKGNVAGLRNRRESSASYRRAAAD
jgi:hypothetical protein